MTREEMLSLLKNGRSYEWNEYRERHPNWIPDLSGMNLSDICFVPKYAPAFNLSRANLCGTILPNNREQFERMDSNKKLISVEMYDAIFDVDTSCENTLTLLTRGANFVSKSENILGDISKIKVFISYAWANDDVVLAIDYWLQTKGFQTKIDKRDFFAGSRIRDEIIRVMSECNVILIFYSNKYKGKPWPEFEQELAGDLEMEAKKKGKTPPRTIYLMIDDSFVPSITESNKIHIMAKGKHFDSVCEEVYNNVLQLPKKTERIDLTKWNKYKF